MKNETIEEAARIYFNKNQSKPYSFDISQDDVENSFIEGVEWQQKRMYSEEDMINFNEWAENSQESADFWRKNKRSPTMDASYNIFVREKRIELFKIWKEQFKK
jgi:hypothetical protein